MGGRMVGSGKGKAKVVKPSFKGDIPKDVARTTGAFLAEMLKEWEEDAAKYEEEVRQMAMLVFASKELDDATLAKAREVFVRVTTAHEQREVMRNVLLTRLGMRSAVPAGFVVGGVSELQELLKQAHDRVHPHEAEESKAKVVRDPAFN